MTKMNSRSGRSGVSGIRDAMDRIWEWVLRENPVFATFIGDERYDDVFPDISRDGKERRKRDLLEFRKEVESVETYSETENIDKMVLIWFLNDAIEETEQDLEDFNIDHMSGYQLLPFDLVNFQRTDTAERMEKFLKRLESFPRLIEQYIENLKRGESKRRMQFYIQVKRCIGQLENIAVRKFEETPLQAVLSRYADKDREKYEERLRTIYEKAIKGALGCLFEYLREYRPRTVAGIWGIPDGEKNYRYLIKRHTTLEFEPGEIHELGLEEIAKIQDEIRDVGRELGVRSSEPLEIIEEVRNDKRNFFSSREEIVRTYEEVTARIYEKLPKFFGKIPKAKIVVKAVEDYREKDSVGAFYYRPSRDGGREGIFYINTYRPEERPKYEIVALAVHEGVPGHHFQISITQESDLHPFRKFIDWDAFTEGWGLYAERLGEDMNLYTEPIYRFGMLIMQIWRAVRLVVDTGIHYFKWTRDEAIEFFLKRTGLADIEVVNEVDRYITWPAQALSYYIGMKKIMELRSRLVPKMSLKDFHDLILSQGGVPLSVIEEFVMRRCI